MRTVLEVLAAVGGSLALSIGVGYLFRRQELPRCQFCGLVMSPWRTDQKSWHCSFEVDGVPRWCCPLCSPQGRW